MAEETIETQEVKKKSYMVWAAIAMFVLIYGIVLIIIKLSIPTFSTKWFVALIAIGFVITAVTVLATWYFRNKAVKEIPDAKEKEDKIPAPITISQVLKYIRDMIRDDYKEYLHLEYHTVEERGKNKESSIFTYYGKGYFEPDKRYVVIVNLHYPLKKYTVLINASVGQIEKQKRLLAIHPEDEPDFEERRETDLLTGKEVIYRKSTKTKKPEIKKEEKKEDLR